MAGLSYVHGASPVSLLGETIGENLCRRVPAYKSIELGMRFASQASAR